MKTHDFFRVPNVAGALSLILSLGAGVSCASGGDGTGSESHFACKKDDDCAKYGISLVCIDLVCAEDATGRATSWIEKAGGLPERVSLGKTNLPPLVIEPVCGSHSLGARIQAGETLVRYTQLRRQQLADACAALSGLRVTAALTDDGLNYVCDAARRSLAEFLAGDPIISYSREPLSIDVEAQLACDEVVSAAAGCTCGASTIEDRCADTGHVTIGCAGTCSGECFGGPTDCRGRCRGLCEGTCEGDCGVPSGQDCTGVCTGTCNGTCTGSCEYESPGTCGDTCVGKCSVPGPVAGCAALFSGSSCVCPAAADAYPACNAFGLLRAGSGRTTLLRAGSEFHSEELRSVHEVAQSLSILMLAVESILTAIPSEAALSASCLDEIGFRLTSLTSRAADADAAVRVLLGAAGTVLLGEASR